VIFQFNDVVNLGVCSGAFGEAGFIDAMDVVERHGLAGTVEDSGFVHVIPEAGDTILNEVFIKTAPPLASLSAGEVGEDSRAGPDDADEFTAVSFLHKMIARLSGIVRSIALVGDMGDV
jgi:hypothetical protein